MMTVEKFEQELNQAEWYVTENVTALLSEGKSRRILEEFKQGLRYFLDICDCEFETQTMNERIIETGNDIFRRMLLEESA